jgi:hypothetical protein
MTKKEMHQTTMLSDEVPSRAGSLCAWDGYTETFDGDMPVGWWWLLLYHHPQAVDDPFYEGALVGRDCALCPNHASELDSLLKRITDVSMRTSVRR